MEHDFPSLSSHQYDDDFTVPDALLVFPDDDQLVDFNDIPSLDSNNLKNVPVQGHHHEPVPETTSHPNAEEEDDSFFDFDINKFLFQGQDGPGNENVIHGDATNDPLLVQDIPIELGENVEMDFLNAPIDVEQGQRFENLNNLDQENSIPLTVWPPPPVPFSCTCCQVLREIVHSNDTYITKLEIHGRVGIIAHGILEMKSAVDGLPVTNPQMIDFCVRSLEDVKQFLMQYCQDRKEAGFVMLQDVHLAYYSTLCVGLDLSTFEIMPPPHNETGVREQSPVAAERSPARQARPSLSAQRKRTKRLGRSQLERVFHLPITAAARDLGICTTAIKKRCRKFGLPRWPYRKIKSVSDKIVSLEKGLINKDEEESARDRAQIEGLKQEREKIINGMIDTEKGNQSS